jgi:CRISPR-associated endonuclease/helicase Cas3
MEESCTYELNSGIRNGGKMLGKHLSKESKVEVTQALKMSQCLAKTYKSQQGTVFPGPNVLEHCQIVGEVARALLLRLPAWLCNTLFPKGSELIAAAHDIGKVSPTFQKKIYRDLSQRDEAVWFLLQAVNPDVEKLWGGHAGVSQAAVEAYNVGEHIPQILGQHHGYSPNLSIYQANSEVFGGPCWQARRIELLAHLKQVLTTTEFPEVRDALQARVLAGLTTVADWIGSGALFEDPQEEWQPKIELALDLAGFIPPKVKPGLGFSEVFPFCPRQAQASLIAAATQPGVYVLEAPMGLGKTEAALYAAYQLLAREMATGIYFALPTQLTSNKIHQRVNQFLDCILDDQSPSKALLVHGNAWLRRFEMGEEANPGGSWFAQGKRGILAPFAVGTIDQALMAVMNVKHGFVRTFGLAGKVVILDEVHTYDSYTGTILDALVKALRQLHCTVIILSATLTRDRRSSLLDAFPESTAYPLITAQPNQGEVQEIAAEEIADVPVAIGHPPKAEATEEALRRAEEGEQVLWIENTVKEAQEVYRQLAARASEIGVACGLLHSRFLKTDRSVNEDVWVRYFGKDGAESRTQQGRILVGTQVLEQSLDIDADFLVTRIAPTDMLLQRLGRLWRHEKTCRPPAARREAWILAPELNEAISAPEKNFGPTAKVYAPYVLCRSLEVWQNISQVDLPGQIRDLIEETYQPRADESEELRKHLHQLAKERDKLQRLALLGLSQAGTTLPEEKAQTRYSDQDTTEVLLICGYKLDQKKQETSVTLLNGEQHWVPYNGRSLGRRKWRELTATLMRNTVRVAEHLAPKAISRTHVRWLGDYFYLGRPDNDENALLRVALVDQSGDLRSLDQGIVNDQYHLSYDTTFGYRATKQ